MIVGLATAVPSGAALLVRHAAGSLLQVKHYLLHQQAAPLSTIPDPDLDELYSLKHEQQQHFVHPVSITQLESMCRNPTLKLLVNSAAFLKSQLPARLQNHLQRLEAMPPPGQPQLRQLLSATVSSKSHGLDVAKDWKLVNTDDLKGLIHFESHLANFREHLEVEVSKLTSSAQALTETNGWWDRPQQVSWLNRMLDLCHWYLLSTRVMLTQHSAALAGIQNSSSSSSSNSSNTAGLRSQGPLSTPTSSATPSSAAAGSFEVSHYHEPGHKTTDPDQPYAPPHQQLVSSERPISLIKRNASLQDLLSNVVEDCRAFCVEKNSAAPDVQIVGGQGLTGILVVPYVEFVLTEVLKNALQAVISRYGAWNVDEAPPVLVELTAEGTTSSSSCCNDVQGGQSTATSGSQIVIKVTDAGNGIPMSLAGHMYDYFWSQNKAANTLYGYSRNHGSPFQGIGVGVPMSRVYSAFMGGSIEWETESWKRHTTVTLKLPKHGFTF